MMLGAEKPRKITGAERLARSRRQAGGILIDLIRKSNAPPMEPNKASRRIGIRVTRKEP